MKLYLKTMVACVGVVMCFVMLAMHPVSAQTDPYLKFLGVVAPTANADRVVVITPETTAINITHFDTIKFVSGNESFTWCFNGVSTLGMLNLSRVAPPGFLDHEVRIYIAKSPKDLDGAH